MWHNMQTKALFQREEGFLFYLVREAAGRAGKRCPIKRFSLPVSSEQAAGSQPCRAENLSLERGFALLRAVGRAMQTEEFSARLGRRLPVIMPYRAYSGRLLSQRLRIQGSSGEQRLHGRRGAAGHFGVVLRREMDAVLTQDGKLPCIEIAAAEAPGNAGVNGGQLF